MLEARGCSCVRAHGSFRIHSARYFASLAKLQSGVQCRHDEEIPSQAMKSVTSFLNRVLAMSMDDQEIIFK
jgi:hypothetical protein